MEQLAPTARLIRFGVFELDLRTGELRKSGLKLRLQGQPVEVLKMLLERPGELVTREELEKRLWVGDTVVEFEHSINAAVNRLREALGDSADNPRFIETLARRGYRFIYPVEPHHPLTPSSERRGVETGSPPDSEKREASPDSPPGSGGGQGVVDVGAHGGAPPVAPVASLTPGPSPKGRGETESDLQPSPDGRGEPELASVPQPSPARRGWPREAGTGEGTPIRRRWIIVVGGSALVAIVAALLVFNVAGLRERLMSVVGAGLAPPSGAQQAAPLRIESIAVLPLENLSRDPEQEYFADGMTEELITNLGKISALRVISRTSVMRYKQTKKPLPEIARELNVDAVVEGSVLRSGDRVRITANLVHARTDRHLWAESYERDLRDVLALQSDVARAIAREVQVKVTPQEQTRLATVRRVDPRAHEAYFRGRYLFYSTGRIKEALAYFQQAVEIDPDYAQAYVDLSLSWGALDWFGELAPKEANAKAKAAVVKALEIDPMLAQAHAQLGRIHYHFEWAWAEAEREFRLAIELNPNSADAHEAYGFYLREMGRREESFREIERANELDPQVPGVNMRWFRHYWLLRDYEKVMEHARKVLELEPNNHWGHAYLGWAYHQKPMYAEAVAEFEKADALEPGSLFFKTGLGRAYADAGMKTKARRILRELEERSRTHYAHPFLIAIIYIGLRENDKAFEWLEKAYEDRSSHMVWLRVDPWLDPLRSDPRFQDLLRRMNFPP